MGGPTSPFPGSSSGRAPRNTGASDDDFTRAQMQELTTPASTITLSAKDTKDDKDAAVNLVDDLKRERVFYTDGRKITKSKEEKYEEYNSHWEDYRLVGDVEGAHDARATRSFEPAPGGEKLIETVHLERTRSHDALDIRYVYDKVPGNAPLRSNSAPALRPTDPAPKAASPSSSSSFVIIVEFVVLFFLLLVTRKLSPRTISIRPALVNMRPSCGIILRQGRGGNSCAGAFHCFVFCYFPASFRFLAGRARRVFQIKCQPVGPR